MKKINKRKLLFLCLLIFIILSIVTVIIIVGINMNKNKKTEDDIPIVQKIDQMENYDYYLEDDVTEYYETLYNELKDVLNAEEFSEEEYAKVVAKLFVTDLFTLDNKITSSDIGGLQFIYTDFKEDFINIAKTTLYSGVKNNIYGDRQQKLPIVTNVDITNINISSFVYKDTNYDSYEVTLTILYEEDLGYPNSCKLTLIKNDKYLQVATLN